MDKAKFIEAGMGMGNVRIGDKPITDIVNRPHGKDIAQAYNRIVGGGAQPGDKKFVAAWVYDSEQPKA